jgi:hypothetical protein
MLVFVKFLLRNYPRYALVAESLEPKWLTAISSVKFAAASYSARCQRGSDMSIVA